MAKNIEINKAYKSLATISEIRGDSSATIQLNNNYYKINYGETRIIPPFADMDKEREILFNEINKVVDDQIADILDTLKK